MASERGGQSVTPETAVNPAAWLPLTPPVENSPTPAAPNGGQLAQGYDQRTVTAHQPATPSMNFSLGPATLHRGRRQNGHGQRTTTAYQPAPQAGYPPPPGLASQQAPDASYHQTPGAPSQQAPRHQDRGHTQLELFNQGFSDSAIGTIAPTLSTPTPGPRNNNTRLWITDLPARLDYPKLFRSLHNVGAVAEAIIYPDPVLHNNNDADDDDDNDEDDDEWNSSSVVTLSFCRAVDARRFTSRHRRSPFCIDGRFATVTPHPYAASPRPACGNGDGATIPTTTTAGPNNAPSRVLFIAGDEAVVGRDGLLALAARHRIAPRTVFLHVVGLGDGANHAEWQLAAIDGQARPLFDAIDALRRAGADLAVRYGPDPCEPPCRGRVGRSPYT